MGRKVRRLGQGSRRGAGACTGAGVGGCAGVLACRAHLLGGAFWGDGLGIKVESVIDRLVTKLGKTFVKADPMVLG